EVEGQLRGAPWTPELTGEVCFAGSKDREQRTAALSAQHALVVTVEVRASARGRLAEAIEEAIERELAARGSAGPGVRTSCDQAASLSARLFRARRIGAHGLVVALGPLAAIVGADGALEAEDSAALRVLAAATKNRPLSLLLDEKDGMTGAYAQPV